MRFFIPFLGFFLLAQATPSGAGEIRIMPLGDSLTAGGYNENGVYKTGAGYRQVLADLLQSEGVRFHMVGSLQDGPESFAERAHEGHSGWRIDQVSDGVQGWVGQARPDLILLMIGTNDVMQEHDLAHAPRRLEVLLDRVRAGAPGARVLLADLIPCNNEGKNAEIRAYNAEVERIVARRAGAGERIDFVDFYREAGLLPQDLIDGVHPTPSGYARMGRRWFSAAMKAIRERF